MNTTDPFEDASEAAKAVWQDTATVDPPLSTEQRLDAVLAAHIQALTIHGCILTPTLAPTEQELDDTARWLADKSRFPRYTDGEGWRELRAFPHHVDVAYAKARTWIMPGEDDLTVALGAARRMLMAAARHATEAR